MISLMPLTISMILTFMPSLFPKSPMLFIEEVIEWQNRP